MCTLPRILQSKQRFTLSVKTLYAVNGGLFIFYEYSLKYYSQEHISMFDRS